jgi:hypothetical protein
MLRAMSVSGLVEQWSKWYKWNNGANGTIEQWACGAMGLWSNGASSIVGSRDIQQWGNQQWGLAPLPQEQKRQFGIHFFLFLLGAHIGAPLQIDNLKCTPLRRDYLEKEKSSIFAKIMLHNERTKERTKLGIYTTIRRDENQRISMFAMGDKTQTD